MIYFAPLTSSFDPTSTRSRGHSRPGSMSSFPSSHEIKSRRDWILQWMDERNITDDPSDEDVSALLRHVFSSLLFLLFLFFLPFPFPTSPSSSHVVGRGS